MYIQNAIEAYLIADHFEVVKLILSNHDCSLCSVVISQTTSVANSSCHARVRFFSEKPQESQPQGSILIMCADISRSFALFAIMAQSIY